MLAAADTGAKVVAVGCLAERYGDELAGALPEADAVLGFDAYPDLPDCSATCCDGHRPAAHTPVDRRTLLPISPAARPTAAAATGIVVPGHGQIRADAGPSGLAAGPVILRKLLHSGPVAPLKIASGCDRRCTFCAIPSFRGSFVSRAGAEIVAEARWLADQGVREIVLVSENSTSYGKDLPGDRPPGASAGGLGRDARDRPGPAVLPAAGRNPTVADRRDRTTPGVADYYDMSFQHAVRTGAAADAAVRLP